MKGLLQHLLISLRLNFRSRQALVYGFIFPVAFLFAFWGIYNKSIPPLNDELGQVLTVTILSGACFGMPTAMVAERQRGVWRRYRLLPAGTGGIVISGMIGRVVLVGLAVLIQLVLAHFVCGANWPAHPVRLAIVFLFVIFAFLGLGLVITMLADDVPAVQALGQTVFLPMLIVGGVGVKLAILPDWARHIAVFMPGLYSVEAINQSIQSTVPADRWPLSVSIGALFLIGISGCVAGRMMFRWDSNERMSPAGRKWVVLAILPWLAVGAFAHVAGYVKLRESSVAIAPATAPGNIQSTGWQSISDADIEKIRYDDLLPDWDQVTPVAQSLENLDEAGGARVESFENALNAWQPGKIDDLEQRVRNLLAAASISDILPDPQEREITFIIFQHIRADVPDDKLVRILAYISTHPDSGAVITAVPELTIEGEMKESEIRQRIEAYSRKLLARVTGKTYQGRL
ncbi:MAG TPA: ABC transporter permease [Tepidisphaeraceae bacterium]|nr:ABC transporter permease [Tepidisphaeraceae bacterium]